MKKSIFCFCLIASTAAFAMVTDEEPHLRKSQPVQGASPQPQILQIHSPQPMRRNSTCRDLKALEPEDEEEDPSRNPLQGPFHGLKPQYQHEILGLLERMISQGSFSQVAHFFHQDDSVNEGLSRSVEFMYHCIHGKFLFEAWAKGGASLETEMINPLRLSQVAFNKAELVMPVSASKRSKLAFYSYQVTLAVHFKAYRDAIPYLISAIELEQGGSFKTRIYMDFCLGLIHLQNKENKKALAMFIRVANILQECKKSRVMIFSPYEDSHLQCQSLYYVAKTAIREGQPDLAEEVLETILHLKIFRKLPFSFRQDVSEALVSLKSRKFASVIEEGPDGSS